MATGIVGFLNGAGTLSYTPSSNAKVSIYNTSTPGSVSYLGTSATLTTGVSTIIYVAANQTIIVTAVGSSTAIVSTLEEYS